MTDKEILHFCRRNGVEISFDVYENATGRPNQYELAVEMKQDRTVNPETYTVVLPKIMEMCPFAVIKPALEHMVREISYFAQQELMKNSELPAKPICVKREIPNPLLVNLLHKTPTNLDYLQSLTTEDFASVLFDLIWCQRGQDSSKCGSCKLNECECCLDYGSLVKWLKEEREVDNIND